MSALTTALALDQLDKRAERIRKSTWLAVQLDETLTGLNAPPGPVREAVSRSPATAAVGIITDATLRELVMVIVRLFDPPGRHGIPKSHRASFPVIRDLLAVEGVKEALEDRARIWPMADDPELNVEIVAFKLGEFSNRLSRLEIEDPQRLKILRDWRDEFVAHELVIEELRARPMFGYLHDLTEEIVRLTEDLMLAVDGMNIRWPRGETLASSQAIWSAIAARYPVPTDR